MYVHWLDDYEGEGRMAEEYIDTYAAAEELGMSRATLWRLLREREIERFRVPGDRRALIRRRDLDTLRQPVPMRRRRTDDMGKAAA